LQSRRLYRHTTSRAELDELRAVVERDFKDAALDGLSADRRFSVAYNAVQQLPKIILAVRGIAFRRQKAGSTLLRLKQPD
jgi:hypothetical protein